MSDRSPVRGRLYLIPVGLGRADAASVVPPATRAAAQRLRSFFAENPKSARRFLQAIDHPEPLQRLDIRVLDEYTRDVEPLLAVLLSGVDCGLMSEAGCPAVADPGATLVRRAHQAGIVVVPLPGSASILLALMASGLDGQHFEFHGYLPVRGGERLTKLKDLEARAQGATQIFIETPYRNATLLRALLENCRADTLLCIAVDLTLSTESVVTRAIADWKKRPPELDRRLAVFLLSRP